MPLTDGERAEFSHILYTVYSQCWAHHRAVVAVTASALGRAPERFETDVYEYYRQHLDELIDEGARRLAMILGKAPPPPV